MSLNNAILESEFDYNELDLTREKYSKLYLMEYSLHEELPTGSSTYFLSAEVDAYSEEEAKESLARFVSYFTDIKPYVRTITYKPRRIIKPYSRPIEGEKLTGGSL